MTLLLRHPEVAMRDCKECKLWVYDRDGNRAMHRGQPVRRPARAKLACDAKSCPKGHWKSPKTLTTQNVQAYWHYLGCRATGNFPDDPIVTRNARVIRGVEDEVASGKATALTAMLTMSAIRVR